VLQSELLEVSGERLKVPRKVLLKHPFAGLTPSTSSSTRTGAGYGGCCSYRNALGSGTGGPGIVGHRQGDAIGAGRPVGVVCRRSCAASSISETPGIVDDSPVLITGRGTVETAA
jgi:hypothetical protein